MIGTASRATYPTQEDTAEVLREWPCMLLCRIDRRAAACRQPFGPRQFEWNCMLPWSIAWPFAPKISTPFSFT